MSDEDRLQHRVMKAIAAVNFGMHVAFPQKNNTSSTNTSEEEMKMPAEKKPRTN